MSVEFTLVSSYFLCVIVAAAIGNRYLSDACNLMVKLNLLLSFILFLFPYRRKITLWAVIIQVLNLLTCMFIILSKYYKLFQTYIADDSIIIWIGCYTFLFLLAMVIDGTIYDIKFKK